MFLQLVIGSGCVERPLVKKLARTGGAIVTCTVVHGVNPLLSHIVKKRSRGSVESRELSP